MTLSRNGTSFYNKLNLANFFKEGSVFHSRFLLTILWCNQSGDHSLNNLAKRWLHTKYENEKIINKWIILLYLGYLLKLIIKIWQFEKQILQNLTNLAHFFFQWRNPFYNSKSYFSGWNLGEVLPTKETLIDSTQVPKRWSHNNSSQEEQVVKNKHLVNIPQNMGPNVWSTSWMNIPQTPRPKWKLHHSTINLILSLSLSPPRRSQGYFKLVCLLSILSTCKQECYDMCVKNMHYRWGGGGYVDEARAYEWREKKEKKTKSLSNRWDC